MVSDTHYYEALDDGSRYFYDTVYSGFASRSPSIYAPGINAEQFRSVMMAVNLDHPELSYCAGIGGETLAGNNITANYLNVDDGRFSQAVNDAVAAIMPRIAHYDSDYERVKAVFEWICENITYDDDLYDRYLRMMGSSPSQDDIIAFGQQNGYLFSAYSAFVDHKSVCNGIAKAFKVLCQMFSIPCICIACNEKLQNGQPGAGHLLNMVTIGGYDAFIDCTNCLVRENFPMQTYDFFLASREDIEAHFIIDEAFQADLIPDNYFHRNRLRFRDSNSLRRYLAQYDATRRGRQIRLRYIGKDIPEDKLQNFCQEVLRHHAPVRKQWIARLQGNVFNALLCDPGDIRKIQAANEKMRKGRK